jgi:hypothetical protein
MTAAAVTLLETNSTVATPARTIQTPASSHGCRRSCACRPGSGCRGATRHRPTTAGSSGTPARCRRPCRSSSPLPAPRRRRRRRQARRPGSSPWPVTGSCSRSRPSAEPLTLGNRILLTSACLRSLYALSSRNVTGTAMLRTAPPDAT